jgi:dihydrofolate reductase
MRKLIVAEHISLDGVIQGPGGPEEDPSGGFRFGGWSAPFDDDAIGRAVEKLHTSPFELLLGRFTYDIWAAYWPKVPSDAPHGAIAGAFNGAAKHVATHRPESLAWQGSRALKGEPADAVKALLKAEGPDLLTWGSAALVRQLLAAGLVDELRLLVYPVVLGRGKRLFDERAKPSSFTLADSLRGGTGVLVSRYVRGG